MNLLKNKAVRLFIVCCFLLAINATSYATFSDEDLSSVTSKDSTSVEREVSLTDEEVLNIKYRKEAGLKSDTMSVKNFMKEYKKSLKYGIYLSPAEEAELDERFAFQKEVIPKIKDITKLMEIIRCI